MRSAAFIVPALAILAGCSEPAAVESRAPAPADIEPVSGIPKKDIVAITGLEEGGGVWLYQIVYVSATADRATLAAAPARICQARGKRLISAEDKELVHPGELPGTRKVVLRCR